MSSKNPTTELCPQPAWRGELCLTGWGCLRELREVKVWAQNLSPNISIYEHIATRWGCMAGGMTQWLSTCWAARGLGFKPHPLTDSKGTRDKDARAVCRSFGSELQPLHIAGTFETGNSYHFGAGTLCAMAYM